MTTTKTGMEQLLESLEFIGGWQWDVINDAGLEIDELEYIKDYCDDLDDFAKKIEDQDYRIYECNGYAGLAEQMEQEGILDINYAIKDNDWYFNYDQLDRDMEYGGDWSEMAWNEASEILNGYNDYIAHLPKELQEKITDYWDDMLQDENDLHDELQEYILENVYDNDYRRDYMEQLVENSDAEWCARYFDYEAYGKDVVYDGQFYETDRGYIEII